MRYTFLALSLLATTPFANANIPIHKICKAGIATVMGQEPSIMKADNLNGPIVGISYIRKTDGSKWSYKCKVNGDSIAWGNSDGRWRDGSSDGVITYKIIDKAIVVSEKYSDGSENIKKYETKSLGK